MAQVGYARVSTGDQDPALQQVALEESGCERIFTDTASGALAVRPQLEAALAYLRPGDVLVVWRLDRLGRSLKHLVKVVGDLEEQGVALRSLHESIDTTTPTGRLTLHVFAALAEFERDLTRERTRAGLAVARARGRTGGRKPVMTTAKVRLARQMYAEQDLKVAEIAAVLGVSRATIYRHLQPDSTPSADKQRRDPTGVAFLGRHAEPVPRAATALGRRDGGSDGRSGRCGYPG